MSSRRPTDPISQLRSAIDCLPVETRRAMLEGVRTSPIIVGAYTDGNGGTCPMLAAHRRGSRVSYLPFAAAWDAFANVKERHKGRLATRREVKILVHQLEASLMFEEDVADLSGAISEHRDLVARRRVTEAADELRAIEAVREAATEAAAIRVRRLTPQPSRTEDGRLAKGKLPRGVRQERLFKLADEVLSVYS